jgi:hypothetical protein
MAWNKSKIKSLGYLFKKESLPVHDKSFRSQSPAIFIGGCGRSGTTLLRVILGRHSQLWSAPELNVHANTLEALYRRFPFLPKKTYLLYDERVIEELASKFKTDDKEIKKIRDSSSSLPHFIETLFNALTLRAGKKRWIEKTPKNVTILDFLFTYFPRAVFVHVIRDGRDVAASLRNHPRFFIVNKVAVPSGINRPIEQSIGRWISDVRTGRNFKNHPRYLEVRYEDLATRPEEAVANLLPKLGLSLEPGLLVPQGTEHLDVAHFLPSARAVEMVNTESVGRWKKDISKEEAYFIEKQAGDLLRELGYVSDSKWLSNYD